MVATCYSRIVPVQAAPPKVKGSASTARTNTPSSQVFSVVQPCSILDFKHCKLKLRSSFVSSRVNHTQLLSYCFPHHSTSRNMMPSRSQEAANGSSRSNGNVAHLVRTMKALADLDGNGQQAEGSKPSGMVVCFGEMLVDFVPTVGGLSLAKSPAFKKSPGGAPANVAVGIARLGGSSAFIGKVGEDEFGHMLAALLEENGVESRGIRFDTGARTALAFVTLKDDGEREFMFYRNPSADMLLEKEELDIELVQQAAIFHYGSISLVAEPCRSAQLAALEAAKKAGVLLSYDINLRLPLWPSADAARQGIRSIWELADIIKVSEDEISFLTEGTHDPYGDEAALKLWHPNLKLLLVTEGSAGCRYYCKDFSGRVGTMNVTPVDTTGAGDAFVAGLLYQLVRDMSMLEDEPKLRYALKFANACGAITTTERGAIPAFPTMNTVLRLIDTGKIVRDIIPR